MAELRRILSHVPLTPPDEVLASDEPAGTPWVRSIATQTSVVRDDIDLESLAAKINKTIASSSKYDVSIDQPLALILHSLLPISRREASDNRMWAWIGLCYCPQLVVHRWKPIKDSANRSAERFVGSRVRQTFARQWWAAELTVDSGNYGLTSKMMALPGFQDFYEALFGRAFCQYRPALKAFIDHVGSRPEAVIRETAKELGYLLSTRVLETISTPSLESTVSDLADAVQKRLTSPEVA